MTDGLVIFLHGVHATGRDMARIGAGWDLPGITCAAPDAPHPSDQAPGARMWFSITGVTAENRPERIVAARAGFDAVIRDAMAAAGLTGRPERVVLAGFSQGAIMAMDAVASGRWPVAGVVAFSGRYATPDAAPAQVPVLLIHGDQDRAIPVTEADHARACLTAAGCAVDLHILPGMAHWVDDRSAALARDFVARVLTD